MERYGIQFEDMNKKEKVKHIWEYYRWHILAAVITVVVVFSLGKAMLFPAPPDDVDIVIAGQMVTNLKYDKVTKAFKEEFQTGLDLTSINWNDSETAYVMMQKIPLMVTTDEMDIVALSTDTYVKFVQMYGEDMFTPLESVPGLEDFLKQHENELFECDFIYDEDGNEAKMENHVYGIKVKQFSNIPCLDANEEMIVGITSKVKDLDKTVTMLKYILE